MLRGMLITSCFQWTDRDPIVEEQRKTFNVYEDEQGKILPHPDLDTYIKAVMRPRYRSRDPRHTSVFSRVTEKSNSNRIHPYWGLMVEWYRCCKKYKDDVHVLILPAATIPGSSWNIDPALLEPIRAKAKRFGLDGIVIKVQACIRRYLERKRFMMHPDVLFHTNREKSFSRLMLSGVSSDTFSGLRIWED